MKLLALDTAAAACSVALWDGRAGKSDGSVVAHRRQSMTRGQSEALVPMIDSVMEEAGWTFGDLDRLGVTVGPGSFTGVRIGLAAARGLALASGLPLVGVSSLEAIALGAGDGDAGGGALPPGTLLVALSAGRSDLYIQFFTRAETPDNADSTDEVPEALFPWRVSRRPQWHPQGYLRWHPLGSPGAAMPEEVLELLPDDASVLIAGNGGPLIRAALMVAGKPPPHAGHVIYAQGSGLPDAVAVAAIAADRDVENPHPVPAPLYIHSHYARLPQDTAPG